MRRRESLRMLAWAPAALSALPGATQQHTGGRPLRIGLVPDLQAGSPLLKVLVDALAELGRVEGRDYVFIRSGVMYGPETERALDVVMREAPDLLLTGNLGYAVAAHKLTKTLPVVMWISGFPVEGGVAQSLARPGSNVTGLTIYAGGEVFGKLVQLVQDVKPGMKRIGALMSYVPPFNPRPETDLIVGGLRSAAGVLRIDLRVYEIATPEQVDGALAAAARDRVEALVLTSGVSIAPRRADVIRFAAERGWPTIADAIWQEMPLLEYRVDFGALMRQAAPYIDKILWHGARPGEIPIQLPSRFLFVVNQKAARAIGLTVPSATLLRADRVIE